MNIISKHMKPLNPQSTNTPPTMATLNGQPSDILQYLFGFLGVQDQLALIWVCSRFNTIIKNSTPFIFEIKSFTDGAQILQIYKKAKLIAHKSNYRLEEDTCISNPDVCNSLIVASPNLEGREIITITYGVKQLINMAPLYTGVVRLDDVVPAWMPAIIKKLTYSCDGENTYNCVLGYSISHYNIHIWNPIFTTLGRITYATGCQCPKVGKDIIKDLFMLCSKN